MTLNSEAILFNRWCDEIINKNKARMADQDAIQFIIDFPVKTIDQAIKRLDVAIVLFETLPITPHHLQEAMSFIADFQNHSDLEQQVGINRFISMFEPNVNSTTDHLFLTVLQDMQQECNGDKIYE